jgi:ESS family glutamate:Na+ symporter
LRDERRVSMIELQPGGVVFVRAFLAVTAGILVLFAGKAINRRVERLREANIPEPVTGGLLFALAAWMVYLVSGYQIVFDLHIRDVLLVYFFVTIGINARVSDLKTGGRPLAILLAAVAAFLVLQDVLGVLAALVLGQPMALGVLAGSISMSGGHGTAIAWAPAFVTKGIPNALEVGVMAATAGLVLASLVGGPLARFLIDRYRLEPAAADAPEVGVHYGGPQSGIDYFSFLRALLAIHVSGFIGLLAHQALAAEGVQLPLFVPCLFAGIVLTNVLPTVAPRVEWPSHTPALALIAELSLGIFLAMSLMSMQLWALAGLAGVLSVLLALQATLAALFAVVVVFRALGRSYDAAVICAGFVGFGLGATPTAMANMTAVTQRHGASHIAFLVVPLVGAFFIDLLNSVVIRLFLSVM